MGRGRHGGKNGEYKKTPAEKLHWPETSTTPLIEEPCAKPSASGRSGENRIHPRIGMRGLGPKGPHGIRTAVNARAQSGLTGPPAPKDPPTKRYAYAIALPSLGRDNSGKGAKRRKERTSEQTLPPVKHRYTRQIS